MQLEQYTPDAVCRALGLQGFNEPWQRGKPLRALRLLLQPSFSPECCIDIFEEADQTIVELRVAHTHIWHLVAPRLVAVDRYRLVIAERMEDIAASFRQVAVNPAHRVVMLDGMPVHGVFRSPDETISTSDGPGKGTPFGDLISHLLNQMFAACDVASGRNAIAEVGKYVGLKLPQEAEPERPVKTTITMLGDVVEQEALLGALDAVSRRRLNQPID